MTIRILKPHVERDRVSAVLEEMGLQRETPESVPEQAFIESWWTSDRASSVCHMDDDFTQTHSVESSGDLEEELVDKLEKALPVWDQCELVTHADRVLADGPDAERQRVINEVALEMAGNGFEDSAGSLLDAFLTHADPGVRLAGANALRMLPWRRNRLRAEKLAADADPAVAEAGQEILERIIEAHGDVSCNDGDPLLDLFADALDAFKEKKAESAKE
jgi:hypothetical protein